MPKVSNQALCWAKMIGMLLEGHVSVYDIVDETGFHRGTVDAYLRALRRECPMHRDGWQTDRWGRSTTPTWRIGRGTDAPKPPPKTRAQNMATYRARRQREQQIDFQRRLAGVSGADAVA